MSRLSDEHQEQRTAAASKIQAAHRGKKGRKKFKHIRDAKQREEDRIATNPKIGEARRAGGKKKAAMAHGSTKMMVSMFGADGGAYMRTSDQRQCRDVPMCCSLVIYVWCMLFLADYGWTNGDIDTLFYPINYEGRACGVGELKQFKSLYYPWVMDPEINTCVKECPTSTSQFAVAGVVPTLDDMAAPFSSFICSQEVEEHGRFAAGSYGTPSDNYKKEVCGESCIGSLCVPKECTGGNGMVKEGPCWHPYGETKDVLFQCIPTQLAGNISTRLMEQVAGQMGAHHLNDTKEFAWVIAVCCGIALVFSFGWIMMLDLFAGPLIWGTVYIIIAVLPLVALTAFYQAGSIDAIKNVIDVPAELTSQLGETKPSKELAQLIGWVCAIADAVIISMFFMFRERMKISIGVIEEAGDAFLDISARGVPLICVPIITFLIQVPIVIWGAISTLLIVSLRTFNHAEQVWVYSDELKTMIAFNICGSVWLMYLISSIQYTTIAGAVATWYFTLPDKDNPHERKLPAFMVSRSLFRVIRYNIGSMIFGSLLITAVVILKWAATYVVDQVMAQSPENKVIKAMGVCLLLCVNCIEKFIRYLGQLAYIEVAIYGHNFCTAIYCAAKRLLKNMLRFAFLVVFAKLMVFIGKLGTVAASTYLCFLIMTESRDPSASSHVPVVPLVLCAVVSAGTVTLIMSVYEVAVETIMICFLEDEVENVGDKPSFASGGLAEFMTSTKSISDAMEAYGDSVRAAKTEHILEEDRCTANLKDQNDSVGGRTGSAKQRRLAKQEKDQKWTENPSSGYTDDTFEVEHNLPCKDWGQD